MRCINCPTLICNVGFYQDFKLRFQIRFLSCILNQEQVCLKKWKLQKWVLQYFQTVSFFSSSSSSEEIESQNHFNLGFAKEENNENPFVEKNTRAQFPIIFMFQTLFRLTERRFERSDLSIVSSCPPDASRRSISHETLSIFYDRFDSRRRKKGIWLIVCFSSRLSSNQVSEWRVYEAIEPVEWAVYEIIKNIEIGFKFCIRSESKLNFSMILELFLLIRIWIMFDTFW